MVLMLLVAVIMIVSFVTTMYVGKHGYIENIIINQELWLPCIQ